MIKHLYDQVVLGGARASAHTKRLRSSSTAGASWQWTEHLPGKLLDGLSKGSTFTGMVAEGAAGKVWPILQNSAADG